MGTAENVQNAKVIVVLADSTVTVKWTADSLLQSDLKKNKGRRCSCRRLHSDRIQDIRKVKRDNIKLPTTPENSQPKVMAGTRDE